MGIAGRKAPPKKCHSSWCGPSLSLFPCWNLQLAPFLPWPCLRNNLEVLEWAEQGPWSCLGSCPAPALMHGWELLHGMGLCGVPHPSWHLGFAWEVQDFQHDRNQHGGCAGRGSSSLQSGWFWGVFFPISAQWDLCCLYLLKLELLEGFVVLVGLLPSSVEH